MMRVAFVDQSGDAMGGAERSLAALLRALPSEIVPLPIVFGDGAFATLLRERGCAVDVLPVDSAVLSARREGAGAAALVRAPAAVFALAARLRSLRVDVVHTNTIKAHALAAPAARLAGLPVVAHLRDILHGPARAVVRGVLAACTRQRIAISGAVRDAYALDATIIPNPLEPEAFAAPAARDAARRALGLPTGVPLISLIGRINRWKGHDRFVRIGARLRAGGSDVHLAIVGAPLFRDADFVDELHAQADAIGIADRVHWLPWLEDPRDAYAASDVVCNCSEDEPFGRTLIEAAACGVPAVCFAGGGVDEAVIDGTTGRIVAHGDEDGFAGAVAAYLRDPALRARTGAAARAAAERFDPATHAARVAAVLHAVAR